MVDQMLTRLAIFDLDGTLIDSLGDLADAMNAVLEGRGYPVHPRDSYRHFVGDGIEMLVRRALPPEIVNEPNVAEFVEMLREEYSTRWLATTRPFPQIPELLAALRSLEIHTAVLSNKPDSPTRTLVGQLFADHPFVVVRGERTGVRRKPDPTSTLEIISELGTSPQHTVFVGDTPIDMKTGANAGTRTVGVTWGFREDHELVEAGADHIVHRPLELLAFLDGTARRGCGS
jgi:phosphoglycolate phosphatase